MTTEKTEVKGKSTGLTKEAFTAKAIEVLANKDKEGNKQPFIHAVFSKFNTLYKAEFDCDIETIKADMETMEEQGLITIRPVKKGVRIYSGDYEIPESKEEESAKTINKIQY